MEKKDRIIGFTLNAAAIVLVVAIAWCNYYVIINSRKPAEGEPSFLSYFIILISVFLCSLLLQGEEIFTIIRRRKSLFIRWELMILVIAALLLGLMKFWFYLLFPHFQFGETNSWFLEQIASMIMVGYLLDIAYMFAAGIFFVRAFHVQDHLMEKKERTICFALNALALPLLVVAVYILFAIVRYIFTSSSAREYMLASVPYIGIFFTLVCSLLLQGEELLKIIRQRKSLFIRWELLILGFFTLLFAAVIIWLPLVNELWRAYIFAAGMLFVRALHVKTKPNDLMGSGLNPCTRDIATGHKEDQ